MIKLFSAQQIIFDPFIKETMVIFSAIDGNCTYAFIVNRLVHSYSNMQLLFISKLNEINLVSQLK